MEMIANFMIMFCLIGIFVCVIGLIKNNVTYKNHRIISDAVCEYSKHLIDIDIDAYHKMIKESPFGRGLWDYIEEYDDTFWRLWDWGYKRILPPDKFELVKPFIKKGCKK